MAESMRKHRSVSGGGWRAQGAGGGRVVLPRVGARLRRVRGRTDIRMVKNSTRLIARSSVTGRDAVAPLPHPLQHLLRQQCHP